MLIKKIYDRIQDNFYDYNINFHYISYNQNKKYLSDFITKDEIDNWSSNSPIFISAQTGKGKNFFIQNFLIRTVHNYNKRFNRNDRILLLGNRIALNRQGKLSLAKILLDLGYDKPLKEIEYYTETGIDKLFIDLGIITICSYQQLYENTCNIQNQSFEYVICDECHFFTSDSIFYLYSNEIINIITKKFKNAIRIYMSATLEESFIPIMISESHNSKKNECDYYYFQRNYNYIKNIFAYDDFTQIAETIKQNNHDKWIVFVASRSKGNELLEILKTNNILSVFITKDSKKANGNLQEYSAYQKIVKEEKFDETVLISTSVLDNGINIKDSNVKHIIIDVLDRTQFVQMLGRVRIAEKQEINLYIKNYSIKEVTKFLIRDIKSLIARLRLETIPKCHHYDFFNSIIQQNLPEYYQFKQQIFYLTNKNKKKSKIKFRYNLCSIFKLIEKISTFFHIIKLQNPNFSINPDDLGEFQASRRKVFDQFLNFPTFMDYKEMYVLRKKILYIIASKEELNNELDCNDHTLDYSFLAYIFYFKILNHIKSLIKAEHLYIGFPTHPMYLMNSTSEFEELKTLNSLNQELQHYETILDITNTNYPALDQQLRWIERNNFECITFLDKQKNSIQDVLKRKLNEEEIYELIDNMSISKEEYDSYSSKTQKDDSFSNAAILKDKGSQVEKPNEKLQKILDWFSKKDNTFYKPRDLAETLKNNPFLIKQYRYSLMIVKCTKQEYRFICCIFVKNLSPTDYGDNV